MSRSAMHFELAFVEAIHEALVAGKELSIPGLGTFSIDHKTAIIRGEGAEESENPGDHSSEFVSEGRSCVAVLPPENRITFVQAGEPDILPEFTSR